MPRRRRLQASDMFEQSSPLFGPKVPFAEAYSAIEGLSIEIEETDGHITPRRIIFTQQSPPSQYVDCSNRRCYDGGFEIGRIIGDMYHQRETYSEGVKRCQGHEGGIRDSIKTPCDCMFRYKVSVTYKPGMEERLPEPEPHMPEGWHSWEG
jgi:hypothetical protein